MSARLDHIWLMSADMACDNREALTAPLAVELDLDDLAFDDLGEGRVAIRVGFDLNLSSSTQRQPEAYVSATFRLVYTMRPPTTLVGRRRFACERALPNAWPAWRAWLNGVLASMGLPPDPVPAGLPDKLLKDGGSAFDLTLEVERKLADNTAKPATRRKS